MNLTRKILGLSVTIVCFSIGCLSYSQYRFVTSWYDASSTALPEDTDRSAPIVEAVTAADVQINVEDLIAVEVPDFDPTGSYYLEYEDLPKGFEDFEYLQIETRNYDVEPDSIDFGAAIPPTGRIVAKKRFYGLRSVAISDTDIALETESVAGTRYRFAGKFNRANVAESCGDGTGDIVGELSKFKNGKPVARTTVEFYQECGC